MESMKFFNSSTNKLIQRASSVVKKPKTQPKYDHVNYFILDATIHLLQIRWLTTSNLFVIISKDLNKFTLQFIKKKKKNSH